MDWLSMGRWSPYLVGIGIGVLSWIAFLLSGRPIGCSAAFSQAGGLMERLIRGPRAAERSYFKLFPPEFDWGIMLVTGVFVGAFASSILSRQFAFAWVPHEWRAMVGGSPFARWCAALAGGVITGFGARWAGGCTSGHGISGTLQLALSSWIAALMFFIGGMAAAFAIFGVILA